jgi:solute carrier family 50 (sugar transporter)
VIGFTFGVVQMGLYAFYRNATPRLPAAKDAPDDKEHVVVTVSKLGVELKSSDDDARPVETTVQANPEDQGNDEAEKGSDAV